MSNGDPEKKPPACRALSRKLDCPNMKEVGLSMSSEDYECAVCGESVQMQCPECKEIRHPGPCAPHWETMESAPTDGTHILACRGPYNSAVTFDQAPPTVVHYFPDPDEPGFYTSVNELAPERPFAATHWMPLPKEPRPSMPEAAI